MLSNRASPNKSKFRKPLEQEKQDIEEISSTDENVLRPQPRSDQMRKSMNRKKKPKKNLDLIDDEEEIEKDQSPSKAAIGSPKLSQNTSSNKARLPAPLLEKKVER